MFIAFSIFNFYSMSMLFSISIAKVNFDLFACLCRCPCQCLATVLASILMLTSIAKPWTRVGKWFENEMKIVFKQFENHSNFKFAFRCIAQKPCACGDFKNNLANRSYFTLVRLRAKNNLEIRSYFLISIIRSYF